APRTRTVSFLSPASCLSTVTRLRGDQSGLALGDEHDLADVLPIGDEAVGVARLFERERLGHDRVDRDRSLLEFLADRLQRAIESLSVLPGEHVEPEDSLVLAHQLEALPPWDRRERHAGQAAEQLAHVPAGAARGLGEPVHDQATTLAQQAIVLAEAGGAGR